MKIKYLGTAAYEAIPAIFCNCDICKTARANGGKDVRTRSQAIVDDRLLIDFPADSYIHSIRHGIDLTDIKTCIITHDHSDHFYPEDLQARTPGFGVVDEDSLFTIYGTEPVIEHAKAVAKGHYEFGKYVDVKVVKEFEPFEVEGYTITPLKADHHSAKEPVFYMIEKDGKHLLYGHDTGYFFEEVWEYLKQTGVVFDFVSLDCTGAILPDWRRNHMCLKTCAEVKERMINEGMADAHTIFCVNHFSHNGRATHEILCEAAKEYGMEVSYDGMEITF